MNNDGLDGVVVGKLLKLGDDLLGRENHAIEFDDSNLGTEAGKRLLILAAETQVHQSKYRRHEQRKQTAAHQEPYPNPRTPFSHNQTSVAPAAAEVGYINAKFFESRDNPNAHSGLVLCFHFTSKLRASTGTLFDTSSPFRSHS